jgi:hypothetical protein
MALVLDEETAASIAALATTGKVFTDSADSRVKMRVDDGSLVVLSPFSQIDNLIVNGGFLFAQRQAPGSLATYSQTAARAFGADRFSMTNENASIQYQRIDTSGTPETGLAARYYGKFKKITAAGKIQISQPIEGGNVMQLRGRAVRFQCKMRYTIAASMTVRLGLLQLTSAGTIDVVPGYASGAPSGTFVSVHGANGVDPTFGTNLSLITPRLTEASGTISGSAVTCVLGATWARYSAVFDVPSNCKNLIPVIFSHNQLTANDELNIGEVGLYDGEAVMDWGRDVIALEFAKCMRTYAKSFNSEVAPAQNAGLLGAVKGNVSVAGAVSAIDAAIRFPVAMRAAPAMVFYNPSAANAFLRNTTASTDATATSGTSLSEQAAEITATGLAAWSVAQSTAVHYTADAEF